MTAGMVLCEDSPGAARGPLSEGGGGEARWLYSLRREDGALTVSGSHAQRTWHCMTNCLVANPVMAKVYTIKSPTTPQSEVRIRVGPALAVWHPCFVS